MPKYDSREDTINHIAKVQENLSVIFHDLLKRHGKHDVSKLESPEKEVFDDVTPRLKGLTYGSDEYAANLAEMQKALKHHYEHNRHHPEHFMGTEVRHNGEVVERLGVGMNGMTLVDVVEMFCDWCAATERHEDGDIGKSIEHNMKRFGFGETLACIFVNTAREYNIGKRCNMAYYPKNGEHAIGG